MKISVVIPVYNRPRRLLRALNSVYQQTLQPFEVVVVDDGSVQTSLPQIEAHFPQAVLMTQPHSGVSRARNHGVEVAQGDWIAFLDSDDAWLPEKLQKQVSQLRTSNNPLCHTNEIWVRNGLRVNQHRKHRKFGGNIFHHCLPLCCISPSSVLIEKRLLRQLGGFDESLPACEDYALWLHVCAKHEVSYVDEALLTKYGGHPDQLSQKYWGMDRFRIDALEKLYETGVLTADQEALLLTELIKKCHIFANGANKRGYQRRYRRYSRKVQHYQALLRN